MKISRITVGEPENQFDPGGRNIRIQLFGTNDLFHSRVPEDIVTPFVVRPLFNPTSYGDGDEGRIKVSSPDVKALVAFWKQNNFLDLRKEDGELSYHAMFENVIPAPNPCLHPIFSMLGIWIRIPDQFWKPVHREELRQLFIELCSGYGPCYGCCYEETSPSILWGLKKTGIPDIFWLNFLGAPYIEAFGIETLNSTPHAKVETLKWGGVLVEISDLTADHREAIKRHLGWRFFVGGGGMFRGVKIPTFNFPTLTK